MKKTTFKDTDLLVSITYDKTYMDYLKVDGIEYSSRTLPIFQSLLPLDIISYGGYEITYTDENGSPRYAYPFITEKHTFTKCVTFLPESKLDNLYLLDLEQALRTGNLIFENAGPIENPFEGFDFSTEIRIEELLNKVVVLEDGSSYEFTTLHAFPEGITGKKIFANGDAVNIFLSKADRGELSFAIYETGSGWRILDKESIISVFGVKK
ncbi:MAG: hypothetical protein E7253_05155 [Lachnospiraceae bacterium]|nr:hypothetical protein [Lachnospiraceae bacterium]